MLSKSKIKLIRSLERVKYRREYGLFVAEGPKAVGDIARVVAPVEVFATEPFLSSDRGSDAVGGLSNVVLVSEAELRQISFLQHPQGVLALFPMPLFNSDNHPDDLITIALDGVQDPGNVGTIVRLADWFGVRTILCSHDTADVYAPKVVQATMGSIASVAVRYVDLPATLNSQLSDSNSQLLGTFLDGESIYDLEPFPQPTTIVFGNEGSGISAEVASLVTCRVTIPRVGQSLTCDSLNVATAAAITLGVCQWRRAALPPRY